MLIEQNKIQVKKVREIGEIELFPQSLATTPNNSFVPPLIARIISKITAQLGYYFGRSLTAFLDTRQEIESKNLIERPRHGRWQMMDHLKPSSRIKEDLFLMECAFHDLHIDMLTWNTQPLGYQLAKRHFKTYAFSDHKHHRKDFEHYVDIHFDTPLNIADRFIEQDIYGLKFFMIKDLLHQYAQHDNDIHPKSNHHRGSKSIDKYFFINYCPYNPKVVYGNKTRFLIGADEVSTQEKQLSDKDILAITTSFIDYFYRNGYEMTAQKYNQPFATLWLLKYKDYNKDMLLEEKKRLGEETIKLHAQLHLDMYEND